MNAKWYFGTLFLLLIYFGGFHEQVSIPNQEIVLEFVDAKIKQKNVKNATIELKERLLKIGVSNIKIQETKNGTLKISYHSIVSIHIIKEALIKEHQLVLNEQSENNKNTSSDYHIDIYQLTNELDILNLDDKFIFEIKQISDRCATNYNDAFIKNLNIHNTNQLFKTAYKANKKNPFTKDRTSYKEPEVRAGPRI
jgi:hypothetical protein